MGRAIPIRSRSVSLRAVASLPDYQELNVSIEFHTDGRLHVKAGPDVCTNDRVGGTSSTLRPRSRFAVCSSSHRARDGQRSSTSAKKLLIAVAAWGCVLTVRWFASTSTSALRATSRRKRSRSSAGTT